MCDVVKGLLREGMDMYVKLERPDPRYERVACCYPAVCV